MTEETAGKQQAPHDSTQVHIDNTRALAILAYIGPLILVSYLVGKDIPFVKFHIKQGLLLAVGEVASWMLGALIWPLFPLVQIANIFFLVLAVVGIIRAVHNEMKELPIIGHLSKHFDF